MINFTLNIYRYLAIYYSKIDYAIKPVITESLEKQSIFMTLL